MLNPIGLGLLHQSISYFGKKRRHPIHTAGKKCVQIPLIFSRLTWEAQAPPRRLTISYQSQK